MKILPNVVYLSPASSILALLGAPMALYCALTIGSSTPEACETPETEKHRQARDGSSPPRTERRPLPRRAGACPGR